MLRLYRKRHVPFHFLCAGKGPATSELMDILGLDSSEKDILICFAASSAANKLLHDLNNELRGHTSAGIVVSVPMSGLNSLVANLAAYHAEGLKENYEIELTSEREIVAIVVPTELRAPIMESINANHGLHSEAQAAPCSLPIEQVIRLG